MKPPGFVWGSGEGTRHLRAVLAKRQPVPGPAVNPFLRILELFPTIRTHFAEDSSKGKS